MRNVAGTIPARVHFLFFFFFFKETSSIPSQILTSLTKTRFHTKTTPLTSKNLPAAQKLDDT
jgi:hypothetical protein